MASATWDLDLGLRLRIPTADCEWRSTAAATAIQGATAPSLIEIIDRNPQSQSWVHIPNQKEKPPWQRHGGFSAPSRSRTYNLQIKSLLLCQLSYGCGNYRKTTERQQKNNRETTDNATATTSRSAPGGSRTPDPQLRRLLLYPPELLALSPCTSPHPARFSNTSLLQQQATRAGNRGGRIRTGDLLLPKQARYRATLRPAEETKNIRTTPEDQLPSSTFRNSASTARARWLTRAFSSRVTIPNVAPSSSL